MARSRSSASLDRSCDVDDLRGGGGDVHGELAAERHPARPESARALERDEHADLAEAVGDLVVHVVGDNAFLDGQRSGTRGASMFSPMVAMASLICSLDGIRACRDSAGPSSFATSPPASAASAAMFVHQLLELSVAGDEVGLGVDLDRRRRT